MRENEIKGVLRVIHDRKYARGRHRWEPLTETVIRNISGIELVETHDGFPYQFEDDHVFAWAESLKWKKYRGVARYRKEVITVYAWTFDDRPPLFWGGTKEHGWSAEQVSMWNWQRVRDAPEYNPAKSYDYWNQPAFVAIRKKLGIPAFDAEWNLEGVDHA